MNTGNDDATSYNPDKSNYYDRNYEVNNVNDSTLDRLSLKVTTLNVRSLKQTRKQEEVL